ncbi:hypothetical protein GYMLUDRAFT_62170 [Collybiopsis luxurians FD-317 M1]|uniref:Uncharacterized protein n=1 Tax=Collybiopsis luxurians FD-317 M1 TaxID=944289 RepID=A0A0D0BMJ0_9AGAR|nr:hypothetical protein GYMLUDRAFT_62170 [Collybiopsis luxurians FD-317 M1]
MAPGEQWDWEASTNMHMEWETPASPILVPSHIESPINLDQVDKEGGTNGYDKGIEQQHIQELKDGTGDEQEMKEIEEPQAQDDSLMHAAEHNAMIAIMEVPLSYDNILNGSALLMHFAAPGKKKSI